MENEWDKIDAKPSAMALCAARKWFGGDPNFPPEHHQALARIIDEAFAPLVEAATIANDYTNYSALHEALRRATPSKEPCLSG